MTLSLSNSSIFSLLLAVACVACCLSLVSGSPVTYSPAEMELKIRCSKELDETIALICKGRTKSLADLYPESFGRRDKRFDSDIFYRPLQWGPVHECCQNKCSYDDIRRYCA